MPTVEGAGVALPTRERGDGPAVLLVHGMASDGAALAPVADGARGRRRARDRLRPPRLRRTAARPSPTTARRCRSRPRTPRRCCGRSTRAPAVVAGDGFGALVALDLLVRHAGSSARAVSVDPPLLRARSRGDRDPLRAAGRARGGAARRAARRAGVEAWLGGRVERRGARARPRRAPRLLRRLRRPGEWATSRRELRALAFPAVVLTGPSSPPHVSRPPTGSRRCCRMRRARRTATSRAPSPGFCAEPRASSLTFGLHMRPNVRLDRNEASAPPSARARAQPPRSWK